MKKEQNKDIYSAKGPMAGYLYQLRLSLLQCLKFAEKNPSGSLSVEKFDDIAYEDSDIVSCLIQAKHSINAKPMSDHSVDLWKTLRIWAEQSKADALFTKETKLQLITTSIATEGHAVALLRVGASDADRNLARDKLTLIAESSENVTTKLARKAFLALTVEERLSLLHAIEVIDGHENLVDIRDEIEAKLRIVSPDNVVSITNEVEGWWLLQIGKHLLKENNPSIPVQSLIRVASEAAGKYQRKELPVQPPENLGDLKYSDKDEDLILVKQMRRVGLKDSIIKRSVGDYYRAYAQKSEWLRESLLLDSEEEDYDETLIDAWEREFDKELTYSTPQDEDQKSELGRKMCAWAHTSAYPFRNVVEKWISSGSFHGLSNRVEIGWHPDFKELFSEKGDG